MTFIERQRNAPVEGRTGNGKVFQAAFHEGNDFVLTGFGTNEVGVFLIELQQRFLEFGKLEEPIFFAASFLNRALAIRAHEFAFVVLQKVAFVVIGFLVNAIPALVGTLVAISLVVQILPELLNRFGVARLGGANKVSVGDIEHVPTIAEGGLHGIAPILRRHALCRCRIGNLLAMFIHTGYKGNVITIHALITRNCVGSDGGIGGAQVRCRINVVNGSGEGIGSLAHAHALFLGENG